MNHAALIPVLLLAAACSQPAAEPPARELVSMPDLSTRFVEGELLASMMFSMGGSSFTLAGVEERADYTEVKLCITRPPEGAICTQAFEHAELKVPLPKSTGPIHILVQTRVRDTSYTTEPKYKLAKVVEP